MLDCSPWSLQGRSKDDRLACGAHSCIPSLAALSLAVHALVLPAAQASQLCSTDGSGALSEVLGAT